MIMIRKIISGGQTGADQGGLFAGYALGLQTGGYVPKGWMTEDGPNPELMRFFGMTETEILGYEYRTGLNVLNSDGTVLFGNSQSPGSRLTSVYVQRYKKPNVMFDVPWKMTGAKGYFKEWVEKNGIVVLNVAGNRESGNRGIGEEVCQFLVDALS